MKRVTRPGNQGQIMTGKHDKKIKGWKFALTLTVYVIYIASFSWLADMMGNGSTALSLLPLMVAALLFGLWGGLIAAVFTVLLNMGILAVQGMADMTDMFRTGGLGGTIILLVAGPMMGWVSDLRKRLMNALGEARQLEIDLRKSEELYRNVFDDSPLAIILWDDLFHILDWNQRAEEVFGWMRGEMLGKSFLESLFLSSDQEEILDMISHLEVGASANLFVTSNITKAKGLITCEWRLSPISEQHGASIVMVSLGMDISQRVYLEKQEHEQRELAEAMTQIASLLNSSLALNEVLDQVFANLSRVVPFESANLMLREGEYVQLVRKEGYGDDDPFIEHLPIKQLFYMNQMLESQQAVMVPDIAKDPNWISSEELPRLRSYMGAPLVFREKLVGFLNADSTQPDFFTAIHTQRLKAFADQAAVAIENARLYEQAQEESLIDELTQVYNRRGLFQLGENEFIASKRSHKPFTLMMFDIDHFKTINDQHGHAFGDEALRKLSGYCQRSLRRSDLVCRYGGDEFVILLPNCDLRHGLAMAERLRGNINSQTMVSDTVLVSLSVSIGVAELNGQTSDLSELLKAADQALYRAKAAGRNCVSA